MADALDPEPAAPTPVDLPDDAAPPMLPSRTAYLLSFGAVMLAGIFGAIIGYGIADVGSSSEIAKFLGTLIGSIIGAAGVGVVAVLVLRAMSEWNRTQALPEDQRPARQPKRS
jgi:high-affinity Fe2+/Pb2+ permease